MRLSLPASAAKLIQGVYSDNIAEVGASLAHDSATVLGSIDRPTRTDLAQDVKQLKMQLGARLNEKQLDNALMTAGAIMGGPHGVVLHSLMGQLKATLASPQKLDKLAEDISHFGDHRLGHKTPLSEVILTEGNPVPSTHRSIPKSPPDSWAKRWAARMSPPARSSRARSPTPIRTRAATSSPDPPYGLRVD